MPDDIVTIAADEVLTASEGMQELGGDAAALRTELEGLRAQLETAKKREGIFKAKYYLERVERAPHNLLVEPVIESAPAPAEVGDGTSLAAIRARRARTRGAMGGQSDFLASVRQGTGLRKSNIQKKIETVSTLSAKLPPIAFTIKKARQNLAENGEGIFVHITDERKKELLAQLRLKSAKIALHIGQLSYEERISKILNTRLEIAGLGLTLDILKQISEIASTSQARGNDNDEVLQQILSHEQLRTSIDRYVETKYQILSEDVRQMKSQDDRSKVVIASIGELEAQRKGLVDTMKRRSSGMDPDEFLRQYNTLVTQIKTLKEERVQLVDSMTSLRSKIGKASSGMKVRIDVMEGESAGGEIVDILSDEGMQVMKVGLRQSIVKISQRLQRNIRTAQVAMQRDARAIVTQEALLASFSQSLPAEASSSVTPEGSLAKIQRTVVGRRNLVELKALGVVPEDTRHKPRGRAALTEVAQTMMSMLQIGGVTPVASRRAPSAENQGARRVGPTLPATPPPPTLPATPPPPTLPATPPPLHCLQQTSLQ